MKTPLIADRLADTAGAVRNIEMYTSVTNIIDVSVRSVVAGQSCGVRSNEVMVLIFVTSHFA